MQTAAMRANPVVANLSGADTPGRETSTAEKVSKLFGNFGPKFATERQKPEITEFYERYKALQNEEMAAIREAHRRGESPKQSGLLKSYETAAQALGKLTTAINNPLTDKDFKDELRKRKLEIAKFQLEITKDLAAEDKEQDQ
jgi:hypothetical protein